MSGHPEMSFFEKALALKYDQVFMELTNICNFSCAFCADPVMKRKRGRMEYDLAVKILDELAEKRITQRVLFHLMGEPLLHPQFFQILDHAKKNGFYTILYTNGTLLNDETRSKLSQTSPDEIRLSIQTMDEHSFKAYHKTHLSWQEYLRIVEVMIQEKREGVLPSTLFLEIGYTHQSFLGKIFSKKPPVKLIESTEEFERAIRFWMGAVNGNSAVSSSEPIQAVITGGFTDYDSAQPVETSVSFEPNRRYVLGSGIYLTPKFIGLYGRTERVHKAHFGVCSPSFTHFAILWNGDLVLCCADYEGKAELGNVSEKSIAEILSSDKMLKIQKGRERSILYEPVCQECRGQPTLLKNVLYQSYVLSKRLYESISS
jgi:radical SAM protein with 4Fe4S-binding SPASM domain